MKKPEINNSYRISSIGKRTTAYFIDDILVSLLLFVIFYDQLLTIYMGLQNSTDFTPIVNFLEHNSVVFILLRMVYQTFFVWQSGMTVGKRFLKIKVIELEKGEKPQFQVALLRASLRIISDSIFYLGYILAYFNPLVQTLHDKLAKTIVVEL